MAEKTRIVSLVRNDMQDAERKRKAGTGGADAKADQRREDERRQQILDEAFERFAIINEAEKDQRERELEDLKFDRGLPEDQWEPEVMRARRGTTMPDGTVIAARPCLVFNKLSVPVRQVINEAKRARLSIAVKPKGEGDKEGAALRQGAIRAIENDSRANIARMWALDRAAKCGRGYYRILHDYANDGDFDQDLIIKRIKNQGSVYLDPFASEPDWSDMEYAFIVEDLPAKEYERRYGESPLCSMESGELQSATDKAKDWVVLGEDGRVTSVRVAEYYRVEYRKAWLVVNRDTGESVIHEQEPGEIDPMLFAMRPVMKREIKWSLIAPNHYIDERDEPGRWIPIVAVIGTEHVVDSDAAYKGIISNGKDAQRLYNVARSNQVMKAGYESLAPWVLAEGQDEGYEAMWAKANTQAFPYLKYKPTVYEGQLLPPPQRNDLSSANLSSSLLLAREADGDIQATTGRYNPSLGRQDSTVKSGKAINALKQQGEIASSDYLDNLAMISMTHEARILLDLLPAIYDRPGRVIRLLGDDPRDERTVMLGESFIPGPDGKPLPTAPGTPGLIGGLMQRMRGGKALKDKAKTYRFDRNQDYTVAVSVGPSQASQRDANAAQIAMVMQAAPTTAPFLLPLWAESLDNPMGDRIRQALAKANPAFASDEEEPQVPPAVQQQMQQMGQQLQATQQALAQAQQELQAQTGKLQAQLDAKQAELDTRERIAAEDRQSRERIAAAQIQSDAAELEATLTSKEGVSQLQASTTLAAKRHDAALDRERRAHAVEQSDKDDVRRAHRELREEGREGRRAAREASLDDRRAARDASIQASMTPPAQPPAPAPAPGPGPMTFTPPDGMTE